MPLSGTGMLITAMDVDANEESDFNKWYDKEHLVERVAIEGFQEARRYVAFAAAPKYFNLYTTRTFEVLDSPAYRAVLQKQTAWSLHHINNFRNPIRAIGRITASSGRGRGSALFVARFRPTAGNEGALRAVLNQRISALIERDGVLSGHLVESDPALSKPLTEAVPPPGAADWYLLLDGTASETIQRIGDELVRNPELTERGQLIFHGVYGLMWDLAKAEL
jgi:hypothetical protein